MSVLWIQRRFTELPLAKGAYFNRSKSLSWLSSCVAQKIDCALSVGFRFLLLAFSLKGQSSVSDPAHLLRCVWHESHTMTFAPQLITQIFLGGTRLIRSPASRGLLSTSQKYFPVTQVASALWFTSGFHLLRKVFIYFHCDTYLKRNFRNAFLFKGKPDVKNQWLCWLALWLSGRLQNDHWSWEGRNFTWDNLKEQ